MMYCTVPVEAAFQVWRVARVLSMGKVGTDVQGVTEKSCQIKPWENFENFNFFNVKNWPFLAGFETFFPSISILLIFEIE